MSYEPSTDRNQVALKTGTDKSATPEEIYTDMNNTEDADKQEDAIESFVNKEKSPSGTFIEESLSGDLGDSVS